MYIICSGVIFWNRKANSSWASQLAARHLKASGPVTGPKPAWGLACSASDQPQGSNMPAVNLIGGQRSSGTLGRGEGALAFGALAVLLGLDGQHATHLSMGKSFEVSSLSGCVQRTHGQHRAARGGLRASCEGWPAQWAGQWWDRQRLAQDSAASLVRQVTSATAATQDCAPDVAISWSCSYFWRKCSFTTVRRSLVYPFREGALSGQVLTTFELRMPAIAPPESDDSPRTRRRRRRSRPWSAAGAREAGPRCRVSQYLQVHHTAQLSIDVLMQCWLWPRPA